MLSNYLIMVFTKKCTCDNFLHALCSVKLLSLIFISSVFYTILSSLENCSLYGESCFNYIPKFFGHSVRFKEK